MNNHNEILLSVVIPTKNRTATLIPLLESLKKWQYQSFEVIIQDNSDEKELSILQVIGNDNRFNYFYTSEVLSAIQNCDAAVAAAVGDYVCFLGDDDCIIEPIFDIIHYMNTNGIESASFNRALYFWPGFLLSSFKNKFEASLIVPSYSKKIETVCVEKELQNVFDIGAQAFLKLPRLYHGLVKRDILHSVRAKTGSFFPGSVPDMSNSIAITTIIKTHIYVNAPYIITGSSPKSMSAVGAQKKHHGEISKEQSLPSDALKTWHSKIPKFWSAPTIWADSAHSAVIRMEREDLLQYFNYPYFLIFTKVFLPNQYHSEINEYLKKYPTPLFKKISYNIAFFMQRLEKLLLNLRLLIFPNTGSKWLTNKYSNIKNTDDMAHLLVKLIK